MPLFKAADAPWRRLVQLFFLRQVSLSWRRGPRLMLADPAGRARPDSAETAAARSRAELAQICGDLGAVLDSQPEVRDALRHLVYVEQALQAQGLPALDRLPLNVLRRALDQFEGLVSNWSAPGLANLRSKMAVAVARRENQSEGVFAPTSTGGRAASA